MVHKKEATMPCQNKSKNLEVRTAVVDFYSRYSLVDDKAGYNLEYLIPQ